MPRTGAPRGLEEGVEAAEDGLGQGQLPLLVLWVEMYIYVCVYVSMFVYVCVFLNVCFDKHHTP